MRAKYFLPALLLVGCTTLESPPPKKQMSAEETLGTYFLMSAFGAKTEIVDFLTTVYPFRSQIITFAVIGFHRDRGVWPTSREELEDYATSSPANPALPEASLTGLLLEPKEDGSLVYTTLEDRQRGREFTISSQHTVTLLVPSYAFASPDSTAAPVSRASTISFDWTDAIAEAIIRAVTTKK
jgi:hypothetical protein